MVIYIDYKSREWVSEEVGRAWKAFEPEADRVNYRKEIGRWDEEETWQAVCEQEDFGGDLAVTVLDIITLVHGANVAANTHAFVHTFEYTHVHILLACISSAAHIESPAPVIQIKARQAQIKSRIVKSTKTILSNIDPLA